MKKLILIFSHILTDKQVEDAKENLQVEDFLYLPKDLQRKWSLVPPDEKDITSITREIKVWLEEVATTEDYILVQGDFGATYDVVNFCRSKGFKAIYSTTNRRAKEVRREDGKIEVSHIFDHVMYRPYY